MPCGATYPHEAAAYRALQSMLRGQGPEARGWGSANEQRQPQQYVQPANSERSTSSKRRRLRNKSYPARHGTSYDGHLTVYDIKHSDRAHVRYLAGFPECYHTRNGVLYPPWGRNSHVQNVPELFAARRIFQGWKFVVQAGDAGSDSDSDPGSDA